ncbi:MAG: cytochrome c peroxidase [Pseudomonadota bacterium]
MVKLCIAQPLSADQIYPKPVDPKNNPSTPEKIALGQRLFNDSRLSSNETHACATCHQPDLHFTDGLARAVGATGETHEFGTPTLYNVGLNSSLGWIDGGITTLEAQHKIPLFNKAPIEMGFQDQYINRLTDLKPQFLKVFGTDSPVTRQLIDALAAYVRTLRPPVTRFDEYLFLDKQNALTPEEKMGMALFFSERLGCAHCHANTTFSGPITAGAPVFHITGVDPAARAFRAPTLRQIQYTAPYMHNGSVPTLTDVLRHYESVHQQRTDVDRVPEFSLTETERSAVVSFLKTL